MAEDPDKLKGDGAPGTAAPEMTPRSTGLAAYDEDADEVYRPAPRKAKNLAKRHSLPTFESSIDRFITDTKAVPHAHDVSYFDKDSREVSLAKEVAELKAKLAAAEEAVAKAEANRKSDAAANKTERAHAAGAVVEPPPAKRSWGGILAGFAVGAAVMFGVTRLMRTETPPVPQHAQVPAEPVKSEPPKQELVDTKPSDPSAIAATKPSDPPDIKPSELDKPSEPAPGNPPMTKPIAKSIAKPTARPINPRPGDSKPADPKPADPKPADPKPADPGLYNPF